MIITQLQQILQLCRLIYSSILITRVFALYHKTEYNDSLNVPCGHSLTSLSWLVVFVVHYLKVDIHVAGDIHTSLLECLLPQLVTFVQDDFSIKKTDLNSVTWSLTFYFLKQVYHLGWRIKLYTDFFFDHQTSKVTEMRKNMEITRETWEKMISKTTMLLKMWWTTSMFSQIPGGKGDKKRKNMYRLTERKWKRWKYWEDIETMWKCYKL